MTSGDHGVLKEDLHAEAPLRRIDWLEKVTLGVRAEELAP